ncbi:hypothetical protein [uncultured Alistipes sp.]|uniref:hypothetical protein n=1 Tax=uncultured Alistipes sp. TaxID=538949 RepID=UPI002608E531|nr:hypothetical protein [uncultured Alistipes sp.]
MMSSNTLVFLIAAAAVAFFVLGLSLTIIFKGHYMKSEIGDNEHMKARGIDCASRQIRREEEALRGRASAPGEGCSAGGCSSCSSVRCENESPKTE